MKEILMSNFITIFLIFGFTIQLVRGNIFDKKVERLFGAGVVCVFLLIVIDMADSHFSYQSTLNELRYLSSALGYTVRPIALGLFISIMLRKSKNVIYLWIPILVLALVAMTNQFTHIMFSFDQHNTFIRGPLGFFPHVLCFVYLFLFGILTIRRYKTTELGEVLTIFYIIAICIIAVVYETFFGMKYLLTGAIVCACTIYYTYLYVQVYKIDQMTGVFNRRSMYLDANKKLNKSLNIICVDLNDLKLINDTGGHAQGDLALCTVSDILIKVANSDFRVYRVGGDEFVVLGVNKSKEEADLFIQNAKRELNKTKYVASFGDAVYSPGDDFDEACVRADAAMYEDKKQYKEKSSSHDSMDRVSKTIPYR